MRLKRKSKKLPSTLIKQTVDVLLATYNGEKFLEEQLQSLEQQKDVNVRVWANDDGSDDATLEILLKWQRSGLIVDITKTQRIGSTRAFLKLLSEHSDSEYVAFCDQDDVWDPIKLITQVGNLTSEMPMAITSARLFIDEAGTIIGKSKKLRMAPSFENAIVENIAPGNTILMNNRAIKLVNEFSNPTVEHYDSWIYLLTSAFGKVECLNQPLIKYRIHSNNAVGLRKLSPNRIVESVSKFVGQSIYFGTNLPSNEQFFFKEKVELFSRARSEKSIVKRLLIIQKIGFKRQRVTDQIIFKLILLVEERSSKRFLSNPNSRPRLPDNS